MQRTKRVMPARRVPQSCAALALIVAALSGSAAGAPPPVSTIPVLGGPAAIAISATRAEAYVADAGGVSVIDLHTNTVTSSTGTGVGVQQTAIGAFRQGTKVYVGDFGLNTMVAFNPATNSVTPDIPVGFGVTTIAHARQGFAYLGLSRRAGTRGRIEVVDTQTDTVVAAVTLKRAGVQCATASPGTRYLWAGSTQNGRIWVFDPRRNKIVRRLMAARAGPVQGIAFTPNGRRAWVFGLGGISVISRRTGEQVHFIPITRLFTGGNFQAGAIAINAAGTKALAVNAIDEGSVAVVDTKTYTVDEHVGVGVQPLAIALDDTGGNTYVVNFGDDTVSYFATPS